MLYALPRTTGEVFAVWTPFPASEVAGATAWAAGTGLLFVVSHLVTVFRTGSSAEVALLENRNVLKRKRKKTESGRSIVCMKRMFIWSTSLKAELFLETIVYITLFIISCLIFCQENSAISRENSGFSLRKSINFVLN
jgi:hypothetical protein